jgi:ABC-2 type transport system permease protein
MKALVSGATRAVLAHEARLSLRGVADMAGPKTAMRPWRIAGVLAVVSTIIFGVSHLLLMTAGQLDPADPRVQITLTINLAFLFVLMISAALDSAAYALYARGDYDLMFSAPLPPQTVLLVRALNVFGFTLAKAGLYGAPMLILLAVQRGAHWLAGLPLILALALSATAIAIGLAMGMVRLIGIRSTRVAAQVAAALAGLLVLVMVQWEAIFGPGPKDALVADYLANPQSLAWQLATLPARAMTGDGMALGGVVACAVLMAVLMFVASAILTSIYLRHTRRDPSAGRH